MTEHDQLYKAGIDTGHVHILYTVERADNVNMYIHNKMYVNWHTVSSDMTPCPSSETGPEE
jgi:hypothetical protein